jgi:hypothetical protein
VQPRREHRRFVSRPFSFVLSRLRLTGSRHTILVLSTD